MAEIGKADAVTSMGAVCLSRPVGGRFVELMMGTYYFLLNDTKRESVHLDNHIKRGPLTLNKAVHFALVNYLMCNQGDTVRLCSDTGSNGSGYSNTDLLSYKFNDAYVLPTIVSLLNEIYGAQKYVVVGGVGIDKA